jgi:hypothetical protein
VAITDKHPLYLLRTDDWQQMRDTHAGERQVKDRGQLYLPPTSGMVVDKVDVTDSPGYKAYQAYKKRAVFPAFVNEAVQNLLGMMHSKPPVIKLPRQLEPLRKRATVHGEPLEQLLAKVNEEQLVSGRGGLLLDLPKQATLGAVLPYIAMYQAEKITNWDAGRVDNPVLQSLNMVCLDESEFERQPDGFSWRKVEKIRVLQLGDLTANEPDGTGAAYKQYLYTQTDGGLAYDAAKMMAPVIQGRTMDSIPFVIFNTRDLVPHPDNPPLLGLSNLVLAIYRGEADYRQTLFMQGQETLVIVGSQDGDEVRVGANATIRVGIGGSAEYIGVGHQGLAEQRAAIQNDEVKAGVMGGQMIDSRSREKESGDALRIRVGARTTTLFQVATCGAAALEQILKQAAVWVGANPDEVSVMPNKEFLTEAVAGQDAAQIMTAKHLGLPLSLESIHGWLSRKGMTQKTFEEEQAAIEAEPPLVADVPNDNGAGPQNLPGG